MGSAAYKKTWLWWLPLLLLWPSASWAATYQHPVGQVRLDAPKAWSSDVYQDILQLRSPEEGAAVLVLVLEQVELASLQQALDRHIGQVVRNVRLKESPRKLDRHGLRGVSARASGTFEGTPVQLHTVMLELEPRRALLAVAFFTEDASLSLEDQVRDILQSIRPL